jgi:chorismate mutase
MTAHLLDPADAATIATVDDGRCAIDAIDEQLLALLAQRRHVSKRIQQLRVEAGGSRVEHSRENAILRHYSAALGDGGVELALAVLDHCRGRQGVGRP